MQNRVLMLGKLSAICIYDEHTASTFDAPAIANYLAEQTGCLSVTVCGSFLLENSSPEIWPELADKIAQLKIVNVDLPFSEYQPAYGEIEFERRRLINEDRGPFGILYDGFGFQALLRQLLPKGKLRLDRIHLVFTNRTLGTWQEDDRRYHLRSIILGIPAIISTSGLVEAPAKPREFYLAQQQLGCAARSELTQALLKEEFKDRFLDHDDPRLTEVSKGYVMQAIMYQLTGEAFCDHPACRLFNAHWQEEMLKAQLGEREYCERHEERLRKLCRKY